MDIVYSGGVQRSAEAELRKHMLFLPKKVWHRGRDLTLATTSERWHQQEEAQQAVLFQKNKGCQLLYCLMTLLFCHIAWLAPQSQIWRYQLHVIFSLVLNSWAVSNVLLLHWSILLWLHTNGDTKIVLHFWLSVVEEESTVCETIWAHGLLGVQWICVNSHFFRLFM